jgi:hypothetical protein
MQAPSSRQRLISFIASLGCEVSNACLLQVLQDTWSDLLLFGGLNMILLLLLGAVKAMIDNGDNGPVGDGLTALWLEIYGVRHSDLSS